MPDQVKSPLRSILRHGNQRKPSLRAGRIGIIHRSLG
jgi:hypothetical protein